MFTVAMALALASPAEVLARPATPATAAEEDDDERDEAAAPNAASSGPSASETSGATKPVAEPVENPPSSPREAAKEGAVPVPTTDATDDEDDEEAESAAPSKLVLEWNGRIQSDLRFRPSDVGITPWYDGRGFRAGVERNQNLLVGALSGSYGRVNFKADVNLYLYGYTRDVHEFSDLTRREKIDPYRLDVQNLYLEVRDLFVKNFDLRVGQQLVDWGVGDQFNPTNNLNADDIEDVLLFGKQQGNFMVKGTYWLNEEWFHEAVLVPVFKPAVLPRSAVLGLSRVDTVPVVDDALRWKLITGNGVLLDNALNLRNPTVVRDAIPDLPTPTLEDMQFGYRLQGTVLNQDVSLSYYRGRFDFPVPYQNVVTQDRTRRCNPDDPGDCVDSTMLTDVRLMFPKMHVYGLNMTGEIGWLKALSEKLFNAVGYRLEAALIVPQQTTLRIDNGAFSLGGFETAPGEFDYDGDGLPGGKAPQWVDGRAFAKWTLGLDYTFNEHVYVNAQWVHGLVDEFGAGDYVLGASSIDGDQTSQLQCLALQFANGCASKFPHEYQRARIGDFLVAGLDYKALQQKLLLRLFTVLALNPIRETYYDEDAKARVEKFHSPFSRNGFSAVVYPSATYNFGNGLELSAGVLAQLGQKWTKFGDPATGGTMVWTRANFAF